MSTPDRIPNRNLLWATIVVDELARSGLKAVCIAPGSRSTPLTLAFAQHPGIKVYPHLDERSASFFALGIALKTASPVALVCTSGSATANFYPAVIEAHESQVPLIILTGDRPPELRDSGANQTIDQVKLYGNYALWSVDMALPEADPDPLLIRYLRTTAARAYATANGIRKGVVHLNMPFRKPLEPTLVETDKTTGKAFEGRNTTFGAYTGIGSIDVTDYYPQNYNPIEPIRWEERGIIVCGPGCPGGRFPLDVLFLSEMTGYPVLVDPLSGMRFQNSPDSKSLVIAGYETFLSNIKTNDLDLNPELVLRFGKVPTSNWLNAYLDGISPREYFQVSESGVWLDDLHRTSQFIQCGAALLCHWGAADLINRHEDRGETDWTRKWRALESATWEAAEQALNSGDDFDAAFIYDLIEALPDNAHLFVGNSLPIRHVDQFGKPSSKNIHIFGNRGASGIDGNVSTALGVASQTGEPLVLLIGDITFYHDMNGLLAIRNLNLSNVTIVLMNNNGGGIFNRLPISGYDPAFTDLFIMPHNLEFEHAARLYGLAYVTASDRLSFRFALSAAIGSGVPQIVQVRTNIQHDEQRRREVIQSVKNAIKSKIQTGESK